MVRVLFSRRWIYGTTVCTNSANGCHANLIMRNAGITRLGIRCGKFFHREARRCINRDTLDLATRIDRHTGALGKTFRQVLAAAYNQSVIWQRRHSVNSIVLSGGCRIQDQV